MKRTFYCGTILLVALATSIFVLHFGSVASSASSASSSPVSPSPSWYSTTTTTIGFDSSLKSRRTNTARIADRGTAFVIPRSISRSSRSSGSGSAFVAKSQNAARSSSNSDDGFDLTKPEIMRYSRHLVLSDVGMAGQKTLKSSSVLVIGAGGLGSPCLMYLAAAGVGHIGIVDADVVDSSNLQRQIIHGTSTVGISKCQSALQRIKDINEFVDVRIYEEELTSQTALRIIGDGFCDGGDGSSSSSIPYDVVVDGSDNFPTKYLINDACEILDKPWVYSAILAFEGQLSVFNHRGGPTYRDMLPDPPPPGDVPSCAEGGVLGVLPGTMGCLQATEVIKILLGHHDGLLTGRVLVFDALRMKFSEVGLQKRKREDGDVEKITELIDYQGFCAGHKQQQKPSLPPQQEQQQAGKRTMDEDEDEGVNGDSNASLLKKSFRSIDPRECIEKFCKDDWCPFVLDVRLQTEHDIVALPFTDRVKPHRTVERHDVPIEGDVLVYCKAGVRGKKACNKLIEAGVDPNRLYNLDGGIMRWQKDIDPSMPRY